MKPTERFSTRAENYARYRWDYADEAIQAACTLAGLSPSSVVADVGAGSGLLTRHFVERVGRVYAVEPNQEMRRWAVEALASFPAFVEVDGCAEAIPLPDQAVDMIAVGQALHWFSAQEAKREFRRILKPGGCLAVFRNYATDPDYNQVLQELRSPEYGWDISEENKGPGQPVSFYLGDGGYQTLVFPNMARLSWEGFFGGLCSHSHAPEEEQPLYEKYAKKVREIFDQFVDGELLIVPYATEVCLGPLPQPIS
jgi:SAM-dependent methyltransferase